MHSVKRKKNKKSNNKVLVTAPLPNYKGALVKNIPDNLNHIVQEIKSSNIARPFSQRSFIQRKIYRRSVRNQIPNDNYSVSYEAWEYFYSRQLLDLRDILITYLGTSLSYKFGIDLLSEEFFSMFCHFIRECSSGEM